MGWAVDREVVHVDRREPGPLDICHKVVQQLGVCVHCDADHPGKYKAPQTATELITMLKVKG